MTNNIFIEDLSPYSFEETVERFKNFVIEQSWSISAIHDLKETMDKNGFDVKPVKVFAICNPSHAYLMLGNDDFRSVTSMMPCRVSIYEKDGGKVFVSRIDSSKLAQFMEGQMSEIMGKAGTVVEDIIKKTIR